MFRIALFLAGLFALGSACGETLYKSVTPDGRIVYSSHPQPGHQVVKTITPDAAPVTTLPVSALEQLKRLQDLRPVAAQTDGVTLYSAAWCGYCTQAKAWLAARSIGFREIDIDTPDGLASFAQAGGGKGVPLLIAHGRRVRGFSPASYEQAFAK